MQMTTYTKTIQNDSKVLFDIEFEKAINMVENDLNGKIKAISMPEKESQYKFSALISYVINKGE